MFRKNVYYFKAVLIDISVFKIKKSKRVMKESVLLNFREVIIYTN